MLKVRLENIKAWVFCNGFINGQFNYAPTIWIFCNKTDYYEIE